MMDLPLNACFSGKVVVSDAGGVLCSTIAKTFAQPKTKVAILDLNEDFICEGYKVNVLEPEPLEGVHQQVLKNLGPCNILVNGEGGNTPHATTSNEYQHEWAEGQGGFFDLDMGDMDFVFKLDFQGTLLLAQAITKDMVEHKSDYIINVSAMTSYIPLTKIPVNSGVRFCRL